MELELVELVLRQATDLDRYRQVSKSIMGMKQGLRPPRRRRRSADKIVQLPILNWWEYNNLWTIPLEGTLRWEGLDFKSYYHLDIGGQRIVFEQHGLEDERVEEFFTNIVLPYKLRRRI